MAGTLPAMIAGSQTSSVSGCFTERRLPASHHAVLYLMLADRPASTSLASAADARQSELTAPSVSRSQAMALGRRRRHAVSVTVIVAGRDDVGREAVVPPPALVAGWMGDTFLVSARKRRRERQAGADCLSNELFSLSYSPQLALSPRLLHSCRSPADS